MSLKDQLQRELAEAQARHNALEYFPDLELKKDRWGRLRLYSPSITRKAIRFEVQNECDCCNKALIYVLPYVNFECIRIYSPWELPIAKRKINGEILELDLWEDFFYDKRCSNKLISAVTEWLEPYEVEEYEYEDENDDEENG